MGLNSLSTILFRLGFQAPPHLRADPHHPSLTPASHPSHPGQFDSSLLLEIFTPAVSTANHCLRLAAWMPSQVHVSSLSQRWSLPCSNERWGKTFVWTFSSFSFICVHKLQLFRLQLTLQSLPTSTKGLKGLSVEGLMKTCHHGMWDGA